jgi:DNA-binding beta-propeller fold protein YncE
MITTTQTSIHQVSRDGGWLLTSSMVGGETIEVRDRNTLEEVLQITTGNQEWALSPTGRLMVVFNEHKVSLIDLQEKSLIGSVPVENSGFSSGILFSPDGKSIVMPVGSFGSDSQFNHDPVRVVVLRVNLP